MHSKKPKRETVKMLSLHELGLKFLEEFQWQTREMWRQEYESIIDDAEVVLSIIGDKLGRKLFILFEACSKQYLCSPCLIKRGRRYVRMMVKTNRTKKESCAMLLFLERYLVSFGFWFARTFCKRSACGIWRLWFV